MHWRIWLHTLSCYHCIRCTRLPNGARLLRTAEITRVCAMVRGEGTWYMHGQGAHLDLYAASSIERHTHNLYLDESRRSGTSQQALLDRHFCPRTATPRIPDLRRPVHAFLAPSRSDITDIATASRIIGGAVDEITIHHTLGRPYAPYFRPSSATAATIALHVSSGHH